jgi:hypothetical protein
MLKGRIRAMFNLWHLGMGGLKMTAMNIVHMKIKPGKEADYLAIHRELRADGMPGLRNFWLVETGERAFTVVGEWDDMTALAAARPVMIANLDRLRPILEDLGGDLGMTDPRSGAVALHAAP